MKKELIIYQGTNGEISFKGDFKKQTIWVSLDAYDKSNLPKSGLTKKQVNITADELVTALMV